LSDHPSSGRFEVRDQYNNDTGFRVYILYAGVQLADSQPQLSLDDEHPLSVTRSHGSILRVERSNNNISIHRAPSTVDENGFDVHSYKIKALYSGTTVVRFTNSSGDSSAARIAVSGYRPHPTARDFSF